MKAKKIAAILFVLIMALSVVGCAANQTPPPVVSPPDEVENDYPPYEEDEYDEHESYGQLELSDENVLITLSFDRPYYTHSQILGLTATVTNIGEEVIVFQKGSGSNLVPDALQVALGELVPLFRPAIATMDMQYMSLEPGESTTFELPFAPYVPAEPDPQFGPLVGFVDDLEFFQNDEWVRAEAGDIAGSIIFSYAVREGEDEFFMIVEGDELFVVEETFTVRLIEE